MKTWFGIPHQLGNGKISIAIGNDTGENYSTLILTLEELEDLQWRLKQAAQLFKNGKISRQRA